MVGSSSSSSCSSCSSSSSSRGCSSISSSSVSSFSEVIMAAAVAVAEVVVAEDVLVKWARFKSKGLFQVSVGFQLSFTTKTCLRCCRCRRSLSNVFDTCPSSPLWPRGSFMFSWLPAQWLMRCSSHLHGMSTLMMVME